MKAYRFFKLLLLILLIAGCGQMGPLYLPGTTPPIHVEKEKSASAKEKKDESSKISPEKTK